MRATEYMDAHPVFRHEDFVAAHTESGRSRATSNNLLAKHVASGRLLRVRKGLYATVSRGQDPAVAPVDPYLMACHLTPDSVVAYHAALQFHGRAYSVWRVFHYVTGNRTRSFEFRGMEFAPVLAPASVRRLRDFGGGVETVEHAGGLVRVTTLERTLVDVLHAPDKGGGWEEIWRSLESVEYFDVDAVTDYSLKLGSAITAARVGFFLEQHKESLMVDDSHLDQLRRHAPRQPRYFDRSRESGRLVGDWNLIVPEAVLQESWEGEE
jgi:predicted transcriptional regulator of viral defense system